MCGFLFSIFGNRTQNHRVGTVRERNEEETFRSYFQLSAEFCRKRYPWWILLPRIDRNNNTKTLLRVFRENDV